MAGNENINIYKDIDMLRAYALNSDLPEHLAAPLMRVLDIAENANNDGMDYFTEF